MRHGKEFPKDKSSLYPNKSLPTKQADMISLTSTPLFGLSLCQSKSLSQKLKRRQGSSEEKPVMRGWM
ncbi:hypothetical protein [Bartonella rochalimae]|uniref:hypothetical protein n=1 Tax=Bartonella rochalimae TaxID=395923 RepID=UPI003F68513E